LFTIIVHVEAEQPESYEFLEDSLAAARDRAEEVAQHGFWIEDQEPLQFIPPSRIKLVQVVRQ
jgi:hypothetical protein